jgi:hypothetical protein
METPSERSGNPPAGKISVLINVFASPGEALQELKLHPSILFPLLLIIAGNSLVLAWYFNIVDFDWYIDDVLSTANISEENLEDARENFESMSRNSMMGFSLIGSVVGLSAIFLVQAVYLSLVAALRGDRFKFRHWLSLVCWSSTPILLSVVGMAVTILLSPNGQLSAYDLDPLTLRNLGMATDSATLQSLYNSVSLAMVWSVVIILLGYRQWLECSWLRTSLMVLSPYLTIIGVWAFLALS